ncbi:hypothetical protein KW807_00975 [Candidatus Parcubacteria bacterium]|nr:hypothetical protein [Candidatus Parcubacteria bacterium]
MKKLLWIVIVLLLIGGVVWLAKTPGKPGKLDSFATCIKDSGALFYGAFWCPHCQNQKAMFGKSAKLLPYIECSTPDGNGQLQTCTDAGVSGYPTWKFPDGTVETGEVALARLGELTKCELPQ